MVGPCFYWPLGLVLILGGMLLLSNWSMVRKAEEREAGADAE